MFQTRAKQSLWPQIEATFKQIDTAATELECFEALQKQELSAASHRISGIWEEVQKQKELERTLQLRYGNLLEDLEKMEKIMVDRKAQAQKEEEIAAESHALQLAEVEPNQNVGENADSSEAMSASVAAVDRENSVPVPTSIELMGEQLNSSVGHENKTNKAMDIHTEKESVAVDLDIGLSDNKLPSAAGDASLPDNGFEESDKSQTIDVPSQELLGPDANGMSDSVDGATIENDKCSTDIVEEVKDVETQQPVIETENNSDMHSIDLDAAAPASSYEDGPVNDGNTGEMESNV
ncbi:cell division cycle 5-like protein [Cucumis melo var. makuwa]|uniref:Cell division cycle 5-like protein n=1 Tax=Cucumis melo var. makuwa TaxID=1194695 RepID=A0A5A7UYL1_CUCMM|nr:cell division cycle 5-like protein [Cucumis melo var. makuwa]